MAFEMYEMANLRSRLTGLPVTIYVTLGGDEIQHAARIKVSSLYGDKMRKDAMFSMTISNSPEVIGDAGEIKSQDIKEIKQFIIKNREMLQALWDDEAGIEDLVDVIREREKNP